ncbi:hypothetical protein EDB89DRAFT_1979461, partial [Lactarius sanguifluus]
SRVACAHRAAWRLEWLVWCRGCCCCSQPSTNALRTCASRCVLICIKGVFASQWNTQRRVRENVYLQPASAAT